MLLSGAMRWPRAPAATEHSAVVPSGTKTEELRRVKMITRERWDRWLLGLSGLCMKVVLDG